MTWHMINYEGHPAVTLGWQVDIDTPTETRPIWHHPTEPWDQRYYGQFTQVTLRENNVFSCFNSNTYNFQPLYTHDWTMVNETRDIPAPGRGGKNWKWMWSSWSRKWIKESI